LKVDRSLVCKFGTAAAARWILMIDFTYHSIPEIEIKAIHD